MKNFHRWWLFACVYLVLFPRPIEAQYVWRHKACLPAAGRWNHATFVLNNKEYSVGGYVIGPGSVAEVWEYDPATDIWTQKNNFPNARNGASAFVINDTAFVCLGRAPGGSDYADCYRYEQATDTWTPMANFPGPARYTATSFVINNKGYVGCGNSGSPFNDFYEYDPVSNSWAVKAVFPGAARQSCFAATLGSFGYMGWGLGNGPTVFTDAYKYDPIADSWSSIANFPGPVTDAPGYFVLNDTLYCAGGANYLVQAYSDCWRYDVGSDAWIQENGFSCIAPPRLLGAAGFAINGHGYIQFGANATYTAAYNDLLEFGPPDSTFATGVNVLGNDTTYCSAFSRVLSTGDSCTVWSTGVIGSQITVNTPGSYWAFFDNGCGVSLDTIALKQGIPSTSVLGNDTTYCGAFSRVLSTGIVNTTWSTGATGQQITVSAPGTYWAAAANACGNISDTIIINQLPAPQPVALGGDSFLCTGQTIILNAASPNSTYHWQDNSTGATYTVTAPGTYSVTVTNTSGCSVSASVNAVYSSQPPQVDLGNDIKVCGTNGTILSVPITNAHFVWNDGSTDSFYHVTVTGTYSVTASNGCSSASSEVNVSVYPDDCQLLIPTGFSPNGDGVNDIFHATCHCPVSNFSMRVYNRWGQEVYSTTNFRNGWDGIYNNLMQPLGVYVYYITYMNYCEGKIEQMKGNITLVR